MRHRPALLPWLPWLLLVGSCGSPPKPPGVDETRRRPVNARSAIELQGCRTELHNTRLLAAASLRQAEHRLASVASVAAAMPRCDRAAAGLSPNLVFAVRFEFASTQVVLPDRRGERLVEAAKAVPLVLLRGRTDGERDSPVEARIARERALAVRDYLVAGGVDARRIRVTYQPSGDHVSDNSSVLGRRLNRRVEVELYAVLPVADMEQPDAS